MTASFDARKHQDKNISCTEGLWTIYPSATRLPLLYGNTLTAPNAIGGAKQIPGTKRADYRAILEALQAGKRALDAKPRMDMPGAGAIPRQRDFGRTY